MDYNLLAGQVSRGPQFVVPGTAQQVNDSLSTLPASGPAPNSGPVPDDVLAQVLGEYTTPAKATTALNEENQPSTLAKEQFDASLASDSQTDAANKAISPDNEQPTRTSTGFKEGNKVGGSVAKSGLNFNTLDRITGDKVLDKRVASRMEGVTENASQFNQQYDENFQKQRDAEEAVTKVQTDMFNKRQELMKKEANLMSERTRDELKAQAASKSAQDRAMADHVRAVKEYEATNINPGQLWGNMGTGGKVGSLASVFASGFLGAKGINTTVMATLNDAIDRNIAAQQANLQKKSNVVNKYAEIYDNVRKQSMSDAEARDKMRAFMLSDFKAAVGAELAKYDAPMAAAKSQAIMAAIDQEQTKNSERIYDSVQQQTNVIYGQEVDRRDKERRAAAESSRLAFEREKYTNERNDLAKKVAAEAASKLNADVLVDTSLQTDPEHPNMWKFKEGLTADQKFELQKNINNSAEMLDVLTEYVELARSNGPHYSGKYSNYTMDQKEFRQKQLRELLVSKQTLEYTGKAGNEAEAKRFERMAGEDGVFSTAIGSKNVEVLGSQWMQQIRNARAKELGGFTTELTDEERALVRPRTKVPTRVIGENSNPQNNEFGSAAGSFAKPGIEQPKAIVTDVDNLKTKVLDNNSLRRAPESEEQAYKDWYDEFRPLYRDDPNSPVDVKNEAPTQGFSAMTQLYTKAVQGDEDAYKALGELTAVNKLDFAHSSGKKQKLFGPKEDSEAAAGAKFYLDKLHARGLFLDNYPDTQRAAVQYLAKKSLNQMERAKAGGYQIKSYVSEAANQLVE